MNGTTPINKHTLYDALPALLSLATAVLDALLAASGAYHPSTQAAVLYVSLALVIGRAISVWLHQRATTIPNPVAPPVGVVDAHPAAAGVDPVVMNALIESALRAFLSAPHPPPVVDVHPPPAP